MFGLLVSGCGSSGTTNNGSGNAANNAAASQNGSGGGASEPSSQSSGTGNNAASGGTTTGGVKFAKTKFVFHAGLAFGVFHRWIYKPLRAGYLAHPFSHKLAVLKAGLAAAFVIHEARLALHDAQADPLLSKAVAPLTAMTRALTRAKSSLTGGHPDTSSLTQANSDAAAASSASSAAGRPINETTAGAPAGLA